MTLPGATLSSSTTSSCGPAGDEAHSWLRMGLSKGRKSMLFTAPPSLLPPKQRAVQKKQEQMLGQYAAFVKDMGAHFSEVLCVSVSASVLVPVLTYPRLT